MIQNLHIQIHGVLLTFPIPGYIAVYGFPSYATAATTTGYQEAALGSGIERHYTRTERRSLLGWGAHFDRRWLESAPFSESHLDEIQRAADSAFALLRRLHPPHVAIQPVMGGEGLAIIPRTIDIATTRARGVHTGEWAKELELDMDTSATSVPVEGMNAFGHLVYQAVLPPPVRE